MKNIPLTKNQKEIMEEFYQHSPMKVIFSKADRNLFWNQVKHKNYNFDLDLINKNCPSLYCQIKKSIETNKKIQSAIFSECVFAQTFANILELTNFVNCLENENFIPADIIKLLNSYHLVPRYAYFNNNNTRLLIQAGGPAGIDSALITVIDLTIYTIEFKESAAKMSEIDLPKYGEDGKMIVTPKWLKKNQQYSKMVSEHIGLNFVESAGKNINNFSLKSIEYAISNNYLEPTKKFADVICTEDQNGNLVMIPANQISLWGNIVGEIRPAGRNHYDVWTIGILKKILKTENASIINNIATLSLDNLEVRKQRGGNNEISGYKINPLFFVYSKDCIIDKNSNLISFNLKNVQQLNPTIAAKIFFEELDFDIVKKHYNF
ncbi:hypothetical protein [Metamycoplasma hominis]|uniref:hypothetical protein n=1 Tax=Metamycoplasma hominis TaxID=2098 RepID=UPI00158AF0E4|nr:hypothetical protein [Metamycoplasma hominis]QKX40633.1 hypothetical protein HU160_02085 [Metamycoplasma hominis]